GGVTGWVRWARRPAAGTELGDVGERGDRAPLPVGAHTPPLAGPDHARTGGVRSGARHGGGRRCSPVLAWGSPSARRARDVGELSSAPAAGQRADAAVDGGAARSARTADDRALRGGHLGAGDGGSHD